MTEQIAEARKLRTIIYRVLKFNTDRTDDTWNELPPLARVDVPYFYPTAQDIGEVYGVGRYMYFEDDGFVRTMDVASSQRFFQDESDADAVHLEDESDDD